MPALFFLFAGVVFVFSETLFLEFFYMLFGILWFIFYPFYSARRYKRFYQKHIDENYSGRLNIPSTLELKEDHLFGSSKVGESKLLLDQVEKIVEISTHFFICLIPGECIILPKNRNLEAKDYNAFIEALAKKVDQAVIKELDWKWK